MKRVIVIGSPGTGKSTFTRKLKDKTSLLRVCTVREDMPWIEQKFDPKFHQYILDSMRNVDLNLSL